MDVRGLSYGLETHYGWGKEHALVVRVRSYKKNDVSGGELIVERAFGCCRLIEYGCECWEQSDHQGREHHVQRSQVQVVILSADIDDHPGVFGARYGALFSVHDAYNEDTSYIEGSDKREHF